MYNHGVESFSTPGGRKRSLLTGCVNIQTKWWCLQNPVALLTRSLAEGSSLGHWLNAAFLSEQDVLAVGHSGGVSTMLVPGAGEPNFDSYVADPYQRSRARQEQEVHQLLDKLQPDMIVLDPSTIGQVRPLAQPFHVAVSWTCLMLLLIGHV